MSFLCKLSDVLWNPVLLVFFLLVGGYCTLRSGFFQLRLRRWLRGTVGSLKKGPAKSSGGLTQLQALTTALASTIGTGSIAGVATAIFFGGPGAVFWMWVSAALGMMTGFVEKALAVKYRERTSEGFQGGPMYYLSKGLCKPIGPILAALFSLSCVLASLAGGALVQSNSIATALEHAFALPALPVGLVTAAAAGWVIFGGIGRVGRLSERLVPVMAGLFLLGGALCLFVLRARLPAALAAIWQGAFSPRAVCGYPVGLALRYGVARGVFTNEAGLGSSAIAHAAADTDSPAREGMWGIFEVFISTLLICSITALVILTSGVYDPQAALSAIAGGNVPAELLGAPLSARAFGVVLGRFGPALVAVCLLLFAFTSLLGWSYYGERGLTWLCGSERPVAVFRLVFLACVALGAVGEVGQVWQLADLFNGLMALPNLTALLILAPEALALLPHKKGRAEGPSSSEVQNSSSSPEARG